MGPSASPACGGETDPIESEEGPGRNAEDPEARVPESGWDLGRGGRTGCIGGIPGTAVRAGAGTAACGAGGGSAASGCEGVAAGADATTGGAGVATGRACNSGGIAYFGRICHHT